MTPINLGIIGQDGPDFTRRHCRTNGPTTSEKAAVRAEGFYKGHCKTILASIKENGPQTAKEIARNTGLSSVQISRRTKDLQDAGLIKETGLERDGCRVLEAA
jgi:predicted HTH transcriptional regulator